MNIAILCSKKFDNENLMREKLDLLTNKFKKPVILVNDLKGINKKIASWSIERKHVTKVYHDEKKEMLKDMNVLITFEEGKDKELLNFIEIATKNKVDIRRVKIATERRITHE